VLFVEQYLLFHSEVFGDLSITLSSCEKRYQALHFSILQATKGGQGLGTRLSVTVKSLHSFGRRTFVHQVLALPYLDHQTDIAPLLTSHSPSLQHTLTQRSPAPPTTLPIAPRMKDNKTPVKSSNDRPAVTPGISRLK